METELTKMIRAAIETERHYKLQCAAITRKLYGRPHLEKILKVGLAYLKEEERIERSTKR